MERGQSPPAVWGNTALAPRGSCLTEGQVCGLPGGRQPGREAPLSQDILSPRGGPGGGAGSWGLGRLSRLPPGPAPSPW